MNHQIDIDGLLSQVSHERDQLRNELGQARDALRDEQALARSDRHERDRLKTQLEQAMLGQFHPDIVNAHLLQLHKAEDERDQLKAQLRAWTEEFGDEAKAASDDYDAMQLALDKGEVACAEMRKELDQLNQDWADDDTQIRNLCRAFLTPLQIDGDSYCVPSIVDLVELLTAQLTQFHDAMEKEKDPKWSEKLKALADRLVAAHEGKFQELTVIDLEEAARQLRYMADCFTHKANFVPMELRIKELEKQLSDLSANGAQASTRASA